MAVDGLLLLACLEEIRAAAAGARVDRVYMPRRDLVTLELHRPGAGRLTLLACLDARHGRLHLTARRLDNPPSPPAFCMLLRKHLEGTRLAAVTQRGLDRVAELQFARPGAADDAGELPAEPRLVVELTGPGANLVLLRPDGLVIDALRRRPPGGPGRSVWPGQPYEPLPPAGRLDPLTHDPEELRERLAGTGGAGGTGGTAGRGDAGSAGDESGRGDDHRPAWRVVLDVLEGAGPDLCRELVWRAGVEAEAAWSELGPAERARIADAAANLAAEVRRRRLQPSALVVDGRYRAAAAFPLEATAARLGGRVEAFATASALCDAVYGALEAEHRLRDRKQQLLSAARRELDRAERRREARAADLERAEDADRWRLYAELILAQLHRIPRGRDRVVLDNLYDPDQGPVQVPLDPALPPAANAQRYFQRARRLERARVEAAQRLQEAEDEVRHLQALLVSLEQAEEASLLDEIEEEMRDHGYLRAPKAARRQPAPRGARRPAAVPPGAPRSGPLRLRSRDGWTILVGRNNRQNDEVTFRISSPTDWWFHAKDVPGAHVVVRPPGGARQEALPPSTVEDAAAVAAYYSAARRGQNVPVDYTLRRHVRKPRGARPGFVVYEGHRTVYVTPDPQHVERLKPEPDPPRG